MVRPLVDEYGLDVEPHKATNFAIEKTSYVRQPSPWDTECFSSWADTNYSSYTGDTDWPYTAMVSTTNSYLAPPLRESIKLMEAIFSVRFFQFLCFPVLKFCRFCPLRPRWVGGVKP